MTNDGRVLVLLQGCDRWEGFKQCWDSALSGKVESALQPWRNWHGGHHRSSSGAGLWQEKGKSETDPWESELGKWVTKQQQSCHKLLTTYLLISSPRPLWPQQLGNGVLPICPNASPVFKPYQDHIRAAEVHLASKQDALNAPWGLDRMQSHLPPCLLSPLFTLSLSHFVFHQT